MRLNSACDENSSKREGCVNVAALVYKNVTVVRSFLFFCGCEPCLQSRFLPMACSSTSLADVPSLPITLLLCSREHHTLWWLEDLNSVLKFVMHSCILCPPFKPDTTGCPFRCRRIRLLAAPGSLGQKLANFGVDECATGNYTSMCLIRTRLASGKYLFTWRCASMAWPFAEACVVSGKEIGSKHVVQTQLLVLFSF